MDNRLLKLCSKQQLALAVLVAWLVLSALAFWWFQFRHIGPFSDYWASFDGQYFKEYQLLPTQGYEAVVVHFIDEECPCSRFATDHIAELEEQYGARVEFIRYQPDIFAPASTNAQQKLAAILVSPAVAIWDQQGQLAYLGPYSGGAICGQGTDFVAMTLNLLAQNQNPLWFNQEAVGCFCQWSFI